MVIFVFDENYKDERIQVTTDFLRRPINSVIQGGCEEESLIEDGQKINLSLFCHACLGW
jgi:hypothetical protein